MFSDPVAKEILGALSAERVRRTVETITENIPTRLAGSENGRRMAEFTARVLTEVGAAGRVVNLPGLVSFPGEGRLKLDGEIFTGSTLGQSAPSIPGGTAGRLVDVGPGDARALAEAARRLGQEDLTGCLLLSDLARARGADIDARLAAIGLSAMLDGMWLELCLDPRTFSADEAVETAAAFVDALLPLQR